MLSTVDQREDAFPTVRRPLHNIVLLRMAVSSFPRRCRPPRETKLIDGHLPTGRAAFLGDRRSLKGLAPALGNVSCGTTDGRIRLYERRGVRCNRSGVWERGLPVRPPRGQLRAGSANAVEQDYGSVPCCQIDPHAGGKKPRALNPSGERPRTPHATVDARRDSVAAEVARVSGLHGLDGIYEAR